MFLVDAVHEEHANEQYFFDDPTIGSLCDVLERFDRPCCLCAPMVGREMHRRGRPIVTLDIDQRFADLAGFRAWNLYRPTHLGESFDVILCDPPFFNVSLSQLFDALRLLAHFDFEQRLIVSYLTRRADVILSTFHRFGLQPTGVRAGYRTVQRCEKNEIELFANFEMNAA